MTHLSLFSGIGGIDIAAEAVGFETVAFVEREPFCQQVIAKNFPGVPIYGDITTFDGKEFEGTTLVSGGFPCQPHSVAGKREASGDERDLWGEVVRVLGEVRPRWFLGENVPGLLSSESGTFFGRCLNDLARLGYRVGWGVWGANDVGAVHRRRRIFIVAYRDGGGCDSGRERGVVGEVRERGLHAGVQASQQDTSGDVAYASELYGDAGGDQPERGVFKSRDGGGAGVVAYAEGESSVKPSAGELSKRGEGQIGERGSVSNVAYASSISEPQSGKATCTERAGRHTRGDVSRSLGRGDWRSWGIPAAIPEPGVCGEDARLSARLVRSRRNATLKALGNAVVPAQVLPILEAIAEWEVQSGNE